MACRVRLAPPEREWMGELSRRFAEVRFEVLSRLPLPRGGVLTDLRMAELPGTSWLEEIRRLPGVIDVHDLGSRTGLTHVRVVQRGGPFLSIFARLRVPPEYPYPLQAGVATLTFVARERTLRELLTELRSTSLSLSLVSIQPGPRWSEAGMLTPRQREVLRSAMGLGYFEVPRKISLTALADRLGVAKSTLSALLAVIERKVLHEAMLREGLDTGAFLGGPLG